MRSGDKVFTTVKRCLACEGVNLEKSYLDSLNSNSPIKVFCSKEVSPASAAAEYLRQVRDACRSPNSTTIDFAKFLHIFNAEAAIENWNDEALMECRLAHIPAPIQHKACDIMTYRKFTNPDNPSCPTGLDKLNDPYEIGNLSKALSAINNAMYYHKGWALNRLVKDYLNFDNMHIDCLRLLRAAANCNGEIEGLSAAINKALYGYEFDHFLDHNGHLDRHLDGKYSEEYEEIADDYQKAETEPWRFLDRLRTRMGGKYKHAMAGILFNCKDEPYLMPLKKEAIARLGNDFGILVWLKNPDGNLYCAINGYHFSVSCDTSASKPVIYLTVKEKGGCERKLKFNHQYEAQDFSDNFIDLVRQFNL